MYLYVSILPYDRRLVSRIYSNRHSRSFLSLKTTIHSHVSTRASIVDTTVLVCSMSPPSFKALYFLHCVSVLKILTSVSCCLKLPRKPYRVSSYN